MNYRSALLVFVITSFFVLNGVSQNTMDWTYSWGPYYRNLNDVHILQNNRIVAVGGWFTNDAISTIVYSDDSSASWFVAQDMVNAELNALDFISDQIGYCVGRNGNLWKTQDGGANWSQLSVPGGAGTRHFNDCHFFDANNGIIAGGWESNDSIMTILKTSDGGSNWNIISDNLGPWIRKVQFPSATVGYGVGDNGLIVKTLDGGNNWSNLPLSGSISGRRYNSVCFIDESIGVAVGGWPDNDSIQTIIRTVDGGLNWSVISDNIGSMLNDVFFTDANEGWAVGDDGVVLYTDNAGVSWTELTIANNNLWDNRSVFFKNKYYGIIAGKEGKTLTLKDGTVQLSQGNLYTPVSILTSNSVEITGDIDDYGLETTLTLEYGLTTFFGNSVPMDPMVTDGSGLQSVSKVISGLAQGQMYYARMKMSGPLGVDYSNTISFYSDIDVVPNFNFEDWEVLSVDVVDGWWNAGTITPVSSFDGSYAAHITGGSYDPVGAILYGEPMANSIGGGIPYTSRPDSISFWCDYSIDAGDTALVVLQFKSSGALICDTTYKIYGTSVGWENLKFRIDYLSTDTPDTVALGFVNSNVFGGGNGVGNTLTIDDVMLMNVTEQVPNNNMESWSVVNRYKPTSWSTIDDRNPKIPYVTSRTSDAFSGNYAIEISNRVGGDDSEYARLNTGGVMDSTWMPAFSVANPYEYLYGYAKYFPDDGDTLWVRIVMYNNGVQTGWGQTYFVDSLQEYELFTVPISYSGGNLLADSAFIEVSIYKDSVLSPGNSRAIIDNLSFGGAAAPVGIEDEALEQTDPFVLYPNPTDGVVNIKFDQLIDEEINVYVFDLLGKKQIQKTYQLSDENLQFSLEGLPPQVYLIFINIGENTYTFKSILK